MFPALFLCHDVGCVRPHADLLGKSVAVVLHVDGVDRDARVDVARALTEMLDMTAAGKENIAPVIDVSAILAPQPGHEARIVSGIIGGYDRALRTHTLIDAGGESVTFSASSSIIIPRKGTCVAVSSTGRTRETVDDNDVPTRVWSLWCGACRATLALRHRPEVQRPLGTRDVAVSHAPCEVSVVR